MPNKLTHEEFVKRANEINPNLKIIGKYINSKTNIECECIKCGKKICIQPSYIKTNGGHICKDKIKHVSRQKSHEQFINELSKINSNISVLGKYTKAVEKIDCSCKICNHIWSPKACTLLQGQGCPICGRKMIADKRRKSHDIFLKELDRINKNVIVIGKYVNSNTKIECLCKICNTTWFPTPDALLHGHGCPSCAVKNGANCLRKTHKEYINDIIKNKISLFPIETYIDSRTHILHRCSKCGTIRKYTPNDVLKRKLCTICQGKDLIVEYGVNSLYDTHPEIAEMLEDKENGKNYSYKSTKKLNFICPNCNSLVKNKQIQYVVKHGLPCQKCSDGISYPMKFIMCMFNQLKIEYDTEVVFDDWSFIFNGRDYKPRFDIVFDKYIVEVDGAIHIRKHSNSKMPIEDIKYIDENKDKLAYIHGYQMIRIDCYQSDINYIQENVLHSELKNIFDLSTVDWLECHKYAISSKVKEVCDYWNQLEDPSVVKVFTGLKMPRITVQRWLKQGALVGMCNYNAQEESLKNSRNSKNKNKRKVICLNTNTVYDSIREASRNTNTSDSSIIGVCVGQHKYAGKDKITGEHLHWMYYEDYIKEKEAI